MDEGPKTNEESWTVEPSKKVASKKRKALRIALIVAALGAAAAATAIGVILFGGKDKADVSHEHTLGILRPPPEVCPKDSRQGITGDGL